MTEELDPIAQRLQSERLVPSAGYRGELRRRLVSTQEAGSDPPRLGLLIGIYAALGVVLLAIAVVGLAGAGPLAA
jgi:hypothetical protein